METTGHAFMMMLMSNVFVMHSSMECRLVRFSQSDHATFHSLAISSASHTWSHANLQSLSHDQIDYEIQRLDEAFVKILGVRPKFLRFVTAPDPNHEAF